MPQWPLPWPPQRARPGSLPVHTKFKTAILQAENGRYRLKTELEELSDPVLDAFIRASEPPDFGMAFKNLEFQQSLGAWIAEFKPDVLALGEGAGTERYPQP